MIIVGRWLSSRSMRSARSVVVNFEGFRRLVVTCFEGGEPFDDDVEIIEVIGG